MKKPKLTKQQKQIMQWVDQQERITLRLPNIRKTNRTDVTN